MELSPCQPSEFGTVPDGVHNSILQNALVIMTNAAPYTIPFMYLTSSCLVMPVSESYRAWLVLHMPAHYAGQATRDRVAAVCVEQGRNSSVLLLELLSAYLHDSRLTFLQTMGIGGDGNVQRKHSDMSDAIDLHCHQFLSLYFSLLD